MAQDKDRSPSAAELDLERRRAEGHAPDVTRRQDTLVTSPAEVYAPFAVEGNDTSAYVGVSPEYMTYANDTEKPYRAEDGVEAEVEADVLDNPPLVRVADEVSGEQTQGGGSTQESIYTATSGEGYQSKLAEVKVEGEGDDAETTVTEVEPPATEPPAASSRRSATPPAPPANA
jgi:hypothetical protein